MPKNKYYFSLAAFFVIFCLLYLLGASILIGWSIYIGGEDGDAFFNTYMPKYCRPLYHYHIDKQGEGIILDFFWLLGNGWYKLFQAISYLFNLI